MLHLLASDVHGVYAMRVALKNLEYDFPHIYEELMTTRPADVLTAQYDDPGMEGYWDAVMRVEDVTLSSGAFIYQSGDVWLMDDEGYAKLYPGEI